MFLIMDLHTGSLQVFGVLQLHVGSELLHFCKESMETCESLSPLFHVDFIMQARLLMHAYSEHC